MSKILEDISKDVLIYAYWFRASNEHVYLVTLDYHSNNDILTNVVATAHEVDSKYLDKEIDVNTLKSGDKVLVYGSLGEWVLKIDIWAKYYFPEFNKDANQWYHKQNEDEADYIQDFTFILAETYKIALKESGLKTY